MPTCLSPCTCLSLPGCVNLLPHWSFVFCNVLGVLILRHRPSCSKCKHSLPSAWLQKPALWYSVVQVVVTTSRQRTITAKRMALTVGAWTNEVLSYLGMQLSLEIWKVHWGHYSVDPAILHRLPQWYKFCKLRPDSWDEGLYYGFPPEDSQPLVKARKLYLCLAAPCVLAPEDLVHAYA